MKKDCYDKFVGKFYKRNTSNESYSVIKIEGYDGKYFITTKYYLTLGYSTKEINAKMQVSFVEKNNFEEITEEEFNTIKYLCIEPFVTIYDENDIPYYCRETCVSKCMAIKGANVDINEGKE